MALAYHRTQARVLGPVLSATLDGDSTTRLRDAVAAYDREVEHCRQGQRARRMKEARKGGLPRFASMQALLDDLHADD